MRFIVILTLLLSAALSHAQPKIYVSILPQKTFVKEIAGENADVKVMVMPGNSPATYEPRPQQMANLSSTDIYFSIGVPFERVWLDKFASLNQKMTIVQTDAGIKKRNVENHVHEEADHDGHEHESDHEDEHKDEHGHEEGIKDPHVWLDPILVIKQAEVIAEALCKADPESCAYYTANKNEFIIRADVLNSKIEKIFKDKHDLHFMVFHPSWGYFADRYHLHQIPVELEGKEPKPADLKAFVNSVKELGLNSIFIQPQFSRKAAELIASETGAKVIAVDPLAENWKENLIYAAKLIAGTHQE